MLALGIPILAQQVQIPPAVPYLRVHGEATVSAQPDRMQMDVGVITQGSTSQAAADANAKQSNTVVEQLRKLVAAANIKTINFSINPNYRYSTDGAPPAILGYTANNTVRLELDDLKALRSADRRGHAERRQQREPRHVCPSGRKPGACGSFG